MVYLSKFIFLSIFLILFSSCDEKTKSLILLDAVKQRNYKEVKNLLESNLDPNFKEGEPWGPIHVAIRNKDIEIIELLLDFDADVNLLGWDDWSPLHLSLIKRDYELTKTLLNKGANPNALCYGERGIVAPLDLVVGNHRFIQLLKKFGANIMTNSELKIKQNNKIIKDHFSKQAEKNREYEKENSLEIILEAPQEKVSDHNLSR